MPLVRTHSFRRHTTRWPIVLPLYDGRQCTECHAVVIGWIAQRDHTEWHEERTRWYAQVDAALRQLAEAAGMTVKPPPDDDGGGLDDDERLTAKARRALQGDEYEDE